MSEELQYIRQHCRRAYTGLLNGYLVTGRVDGVFCSLFCLESFVSAQRASMSKAMEEIYHEYERGGHG